MANLKSSKKDLRRIAKRRVRNQATKSALKTYVKKVRAAASVATPDAETVQKALLTATSALDKASQRGIIHKNQAARRKSRVAKAANKAAAAVTAA
ncbi:30S ribosomal protein S20 [bacterium]|nr:MAG: 30S ribosomal protein S20 [bacterium]